jgi:hypothetical protein
MSRKVAKDDPICRKLAFSHGEHKLPPRSSVDTTPFTLDELRQSTSSTSARVSLPLTLVCGQSMTSI